MINPEIVALEQEENRIMAEGFVENVYNDLNDIKHSFFRIGFRLHEANKLKYYKALGYQNITELAEDKFGFKQSTTYELMGIYELARDERMPMQIADKYDKFSKSQLAELCKVKYWSDDFMKIVSPADTVADIKEAVKIWNKHYLDSAAHLSKSISELIDEYGEPKKPVEQDEPAPQQLPGQTVIDLSEPDEEFAELETENFSEYSEKSDVSAEAETSEALAPISDDELINSCLKRRMGIIKKFEIYTKFNESPGRNEFVNFIKNLYGTGEHLRPNVSIKFGPTLGVIIRMDSGRKIELPWTYVAGRISRLIEANEYLTAEEQAAYIDWKAQQDGLTVLVEEPTARSPEGSISDAEYDDLIRSLDSLIYPKKIKRVEHLNFKNDKARREWLDNFRKWGVWIDVPEVNKTFYRYNFANGCALIVETGIQYYKYSINGDKEIEYISYSIIDGIHGKFDSRGISYTLVIQWLSEHREEI